MIENALIVEYDPFSSESRITICKDGKRSYANAHSTIDDLARGIMALAYENNIFDVKVHGPFQIERKLDEVVRCYESSEYSVNNIKIGGLAL